MTAAPIICSPGPGCRHSHCRRPTAATVDLAALAGRSLADRLSLDRAPRPSQSARLGRDSRRARLDARARRLSRPSCRRLPSCGVTPVRVEPSDHGISARAGRAARLPFPILSDARRALRRGSSAAELHRRRRDLSQASHAAGRGGTHRERVLSRPRSCGPRRQSCSLSFGERPRATRPRRPRPNSRAGRALPRDSRASSGMPSR